MFGQPSGAENQGILAWHFLSDSCVLEHFDSVWVRPGMTLTVTPPLDIDKNGLHGSVEPLDALSYASGPTICRVKLSGDILEDTDKHRLCAERRTVIWAAYASETLYEFACSCAEEAIQTATDAGYVLPRWVAEAIAARRAWLKGGYTDREIAHVCLDVDYEMRQALQDKSYTSMLIGNVEEAAYLAVRAVMYQGERGVSYPEYAAQEAARLERLAVSLQEKLTQKAEQRKMLAVKKKQNTKLKKMLRSLIK